MGKTVRKLRPVDNWRIGENENWFQELAAKGLHVQKVGQFFASFTKGEPKQMHYRIEVSLDKQVSSEQIDLYAENGWDYVTKYQSFQLYSSPIERNAPELHTDPTEQAFTLDDLNIKLIMNTTLAIFATIIMIAMFLSIWVMDRTIVYYFTKGTAFQEVILIIFISFLAYQEFRSAHAIYLLRKQLKLGNPINHHAPWRKHTFHAFVFIFSILFTISCIAFPLIGLIKAERHSIPAIDIDTPIIRLAEVENNTELIYNPDLHADYAEKIPWTKSYNKGWSLLAPTQYESFEEAIVPNVPSSDENEEYTPFITSEIYQLSVPSLAKQLVNDLVTRYTDEYEENPLGEIIEERFDQLFVREDDYSVAIFASKNEIVYYVNYYGNADSDTIIDLIAEKMIAFED